MAVIKNEDATTTVVQKLKPVFDVASLQQRQQPTSAAPKLTPRQHLVEYIKQLFDITSLTPLLERQINKYVTENGISYQEIEACLRLAGKKSVWNLRYGIGCVPNLIVKVRQQEAQQKAEEKRREDAAEELKKHNKLVFKIDMIQFPTRSKQKYSLDGDGDGDGDGDEVK